MEEDYSQIQVDEINTTLELLTLMLDVNKVN